MELTEGTCLRSHVGSWWRAELELEGNEKYIEHNILRGQAGKEMVRTTGSIEEEGPEGTGPGVGARQGDQFHPSGLRSDWRKLCYWSPVRAGAWQGAARVGAVIVEGLSHPLDASLVKQRGRREGIPQPPPPTTTG